MNKKRRKSRLETELIAYSFVLMTVRVYARQGAIHEVA